MGTLVARKRDYDNGLDLYETPVEITEMLLNRLDLKEDAYVLEPANGLGAISNVIKDYGYVCDTADIRDGQNFFDLEDNQKYDAVITNPPYKYAQSFVEKALKQTVEGGVVAFLLRLSFLEKQEEIPFFQG